MVQVRGRESPAAGCAFASQNLNAWWETSATVAERAAKCGLLGGRGVLAVPECGEQAVEERRGQCLSHSQYSGG